MNNFVLCIDVLGQNGHFWLCLPIRVKWSLFSGFTHLGKMARRTDGRTDGQADRQTDRQTYVGRLRLQKSKQININFLKIIQIG